MRGAKAWLQLNAFKLHNVFVGKGTRKHEYIKTYFFSSNVSCFGRMDSCETREANVAVSGSVCSSWIPLQSSSCSCFNALAVSPFPKTSLGMPVLPEIVIGVGATFNNNLLFFRKIWIHVGVTCKLCQCISGLFNTGFCAILVLPAHCSDWFCYCALCYCRISV